jgi:predicted transcriptional regulator
MTSPNRNRPPLALPTAAELDILAVLWTLGTATVREVHDQLGKDNRYTTTLKTMQLMTEKGLISRAQRFGSPASREELDEIRGMLDAFAKDK